MNAMRNSSTSVREQILQAILTTITPTATALGASVWRSPTVALTREQCPALLLLPQSETLAERANDRVTRELTLRITVLVRSIPSVADKTPESLADHLLCAAHATMMGDVTVGGLALSLRELESEWELDDADGVAYSLSTQYQIHYRTLVSDMRCQA